MSMRGIQRNNLAVGLIVVVLTLFPSPRVSAQGKSDTERDDLIGLVHTVLLETAPVTCRSGECVEGKKSVLSRKVYEPNGKAVGDRAGFTVIEPRTRMHFFPFDESVPRIEQPVYGETGALLYTDVYTYDNKGRRAEHVNYDAGDAPRYRRLIVFDDHGRLVECNDYDGKGRLEAWSKLTRDGRGNIIVSEEAEGSFYRKVVYVYEFDYMGNWIKATNTSCVFKDGLCTPESSGAKYRTITYY